MKEEFAKQILEKVRDDYDTIADDFSATRKTLWPEMERFKAFVKDGDRVLDIGCGNGRAYQLFSGMAIEYEGIDVSERLIDRAKELVRDQLATFRVGSMLALPYDDGSFDAAMAIAVLHHIPSRQYRLQALREAHRVLKPGGWYFMTNWDRWRMQYLPQLATATLKKLLGLSRYDFKDILLPWKGGASRAMRYYHAFTKGELHRLCQAAGFEVAEHYSVKGNLVTICRKKTP